MLRASMAKISLEKGIFLKLMKPLQRFIVKIRKLVEIKSYQKFSRNYTGHHSFQMVFT